MEKQEQQQQDFEQENNRKDLLDLLTAVFLYFSFTFLLTLLCLLGKAERGTNCLHSYKNYIKEKLIQNYINKYNKSGITTKSKEKQKEDGKHKYYEQTIKKKKEKLEKSTSEGSWVLEGNKNTTITETKQNEK